MQCVKGCACPPGYVIDPRRRTKSCISARWCPPRCPPEIPFSSLRVHLRTEMRHTQAKEVLQTLLRGRLRLQVALR
ncbi:hypothetical protein MTO96_026008 [Rhipicephalus appendiculatus]